MPINPGLRLACVTFICVLWGSLACCRPTAAQQVTLRVGHFPNVTHVQALVAHALSRQGKGWFEERLGSGVTIEWYVYNAGPGAMEAVFADTVDMTYVGPSPAINAYAKARGEDIRIIAGAAEGGAALVVPTASTARAPADFTGLRIATPQLGNTQDVSARAWLTDGGLRVTLSGGDVQVVPTSNPDQLALFKTGQVDAVWTVEPWVSRLLREAGGRILVEEKDSITTVLVAAKKILDRQRDLTRRFAAAHAALTEWIRDHPDDARRLVREELEAETHTQVNADLIGQAWGRIILTNTVAKADLDRFVIKARQAGFLRTAPDLSRLIEVP
jgi:NitT/TauT family transport system substrate-binding protein